MRLFEFLVFAIVFVASCAFGFGVLCLLGSLFQVVAIAIALLQIVAEGYRWQMFPAYFIREIANRMSLLIHVLSTVLPKFITVG